ncbi:MAG: hypothetical protein I3J02_11335 [Prevotella sp.]|nr:hypothetical protein [Prevotella sp.]
MKHVGIILVALALLTSCGIDQKKYDAEVARVDSLQKVLAQNNTLIKAQGDSIKILRFPADQRLAKVQSLVGDGKLEEALKEITELKKYFPISNESKACDGLVATINQKKEEIRKEQERIKALGFKAITPSTAFKIDYNTITIIGLAIGKIYTFDYRSDEWSYRDADRGKKYVTATMLVKSTNLEPKLPQLAVYKISGDKMIYVESFNTEFAHWEDYATYLGNYHDSKNDFSKVSTVKFKIGVEVSESVVSRPFAVICKKQNELSKSYDRFKNPPVSYNGHVSYPSTLSAESFQKNYVLVKL